MTDQSTIHACPPDGAGGLMPCCGKTPFEVPRSDRMTIHPGDVTCVPEPVQAPDPTREELIALCERGFVSQDKWTDRDSARAQMQLGENLALLKAGCDFVFRPDIGKKDFGINTWWVEFSYRGFNYFEGGLDPYEDRDAYLDTETGYIPTAARLDRADGKDWY